MGYTVLDVEAFLLPHGLMISPFLPALRKGVLEDFLLYVMNRQDYISCILTAQGTPLGGLERIQLLTVKTAFSFALTSMVEPILVELFPSLLELSQSHVLSSLCTLINLLVIAPVTNFVSTIAFKSVNLFAWVDRHDPTFKSNHPLLFMLVIIASRSSGVLMALLTLALLIWTSLYSTGGESRVLLYTYLFVCSISLIYFPKYSHFDDVEESIQSLQECCIAFNQSIHTSRWILGTFTYNRGHSNSGFTRS